MNSQHFANFIIIIQFTDSIRLPKMDFNLQRPRPMAISSDGLDFRYHATSDDPNDDPDPQPMNASLIFPSPLNLGPGQNLNFLAAAANQDPIFFLGDQNQDHNPGAFWSDNGSPIISDGTLLKTTILRTPACSGQVTLMAVDSLNLCRGNPVDDFDNLAQRLWSVYASNQAARFVLCIKNRSQELINLTFFGKFPVLRAVCVVVCVTPMSDDGRHTLSSSQILGERMRCDDAVEHAAKGADDRTVQWFGKQGFPIISNDQFRDWAIVDELFEDITFQTEVTYWDPWIGNIYKEWFPVKLD